MHYKYVHNALQMHALSKVLPFFLNNWILRFLKFELWAGESYMFYTYLKLTIAPAQLKLERQQFRFIYSFFEICPFLQFHILHPNKKCLLIAICFVLVRVHAWFPALKSEGLCIDTVLIVVYLSRNN